MDTVVAVYVDGSAAAEDVCAAIEGLAMPPGIDSVAVTTAATDDFGCRTAVDLTGTFDEDTHGRRIARLYAAQLSDALGVPAFAVHDLLMAEQAAW
jgi:hypothetical protein